ncbi:MAG: DEAD/DEAH box helicase [Thermoprotei archaeon]
MGLHPAVEKIFNERFSAMTPPQALAIPHILSGENVLLIAPTGSGKTEAALIPILSGIVSMGRQKGIKALYITPLRALNRDMLDRISWWSARLDIRVAVRHGDTGNLEREGQARSPPDLLITTPETLQAILTGKVLMKYMSFLRWVVVDEVHELASSKRGAQLSVGLERLRALAGEFQLVGLSATVGTPEEVGKYIFSRDLSVLRWEENKARDYTVSFFGGLGSYKKRLARLAELVSAHKTIVFVNSRTLAEDVGHELSTINGLAVHHGSLSRIERQEVEEGFKNGRLKGVVATSTLELGIDVGSVDYVVQYMSPRRVTDLIQRFGRSGHAIGSASKGEIMAVSVEDGLEALACLSLLREGYLEAPTLPVAPLDVAAHQLLGIGMDMETDAAKKSEAESLLRRASPFSAISKNELDKLWSFMEKMKLIIVNGDEYTVTKRGRIVYLKNLSMIDDEKLYPVIDTASNKRIASLGMEFVVTRMYTGMNIILKGRVWKVLRGPTKGDEKVIVEPSTGLAAIPGWDGEMAPVPREVAALAAEFRAKPPLEYASEESRDEFKNAIQAETATCASMGMPLPNDRSLVVEAFANYLVIHYPLGDLGNRALGFMLESKLREYMRYWWSDAYRVTLELSVDGKGLAGTVKRVLERPPLNVEGYMKDYFLGRFPFAYQMKFVAERFGALERRTTYENQVQAFPVIYKNTPIYDEALREGLENRLSLSALKDLLNGIREGRISVLLRAEGDNGMSPLAAYSLRSVALAELPASDSTLSFFKSTLNLTDMTLMCVECGYVVCECKVGDYKPSRCPVCGSTFLAPVFGFRRLEELKEVFRKKKSREKLNEQELKLFSEAKRGADILLIYGLRGAEALSVYGVGPEMASRILSKMQDEETFLKSLMAARTKYLETKPYWRWAFTPRSKRFLMRDSAP